MTASTELKNANPLYDLAQKRIPGLRKAGPREALGLCPFHTEHTPSFRVYGIDQPGAHQHFHCYGCGAHGDVVTFVSQLDGRSPALVLREMRAQHDGTQPRRRRRKSEQASIVAPTDTPFVPPAIQRQEPDVSSLTAWLQRKDLVPGRGLEIVWRYLAGRLHLPYRTVADALPDLEAAGSPALALRAMDEQSRWVDVHCGAAGVFWARTPTGRLTALWRVWVSEDGLAKAAMDRPKRAGAGSSMGGAVVFGTANAATYLVLVEGIETAAALWFALLLATPPERRAELDCIAVVATLSATWMGGYELPESAKRVLYVADRDEAKPRPAGEVPPGLAGALAARGRHSAARPDIEFRIALPGNAKQKVDALDVLVSGLDDISPVAVIDGSLEDDGEFFRRWKAAARPLTEIVLDGACVLPPERPSDLPPQELVLDPADRAYLELVRQTLPVPALLSGQILEHRLMDDRRAWLCRREVDLQGVVSYYPVCTSMAVASIVRRRETEQEGIELALFDSRRRLRRVVLWSAQRTKTGVNVAFERLFDAGFAVVDASLVTRIIQAPPYAPLTTVVAQPGWHTIDGREFYVLPTGEIYAGGNEINAGVLLDDAVRLSPDVCRNGTLDEWQAMVATLADMYSKHAVHHFVLGLLAGISGPGIAAASLDGTGVLAMTGRTTVGKSLSARLAAGAISRPVLGSPGAYQSLSQTANSPEADAQRVSGATLVLEETGVTADPAELSRLVYMLSGGSGKGRLDVDHQAKARKQWSIMVLITSERTLGQMLQEAKKTAQDGLRARVVELDFTGGPTLPRDEISALEDKIQAAYGHALPAMARLLTAERPDDPRPVTERLRRAIARALEGLLELTGEVPPYLVRSARTLAAMLVCGQIAQRGGLISPDLDIKRAVVWAWEQMCNEALSPQQRAAMNLAAWVARRIGGAIAPMPFTTRGEIRAARLLNSAKQGDRHKGRTSAPEEISALDEQIMAHAEALRSYRQPLTVEGWYTDDLVAIPTDVLRQIVGGTLTDKGAAQMLSGLGLLAVTEGNGRATVRAFVHEGIWRAPCAVYVLSRSALQRIDGASNGAGLQQAEAV